MLCVICASTFLCSLLGCRPNPQPAHRCFLHRCKCTACLFRGPRTAATAASGTSDPPANPGSPPMSVGWAGQFMLGDPPGPLTSPPNTTCGMRKRPGRNYVAITWQLRQFRGNCGRNWGYCRSVQGRSAPTGSHPLLPPVGLGPSLRASKPPPVRRFALGCVHGMHHGG